MVLKQTQPPTTHDVAKVVIQCGHITLFKCNVHGLKVHNNKGLITPKTTSSNDLSSATCVLECWKMGFMWVYFFFVWSIQCNNVD